MVNNNNLSDSVNTSNETNTQTEDEMLIEQAEISDFVFKHFTGLTQF